jgi:hypothetical protein
VKQANAVDCTSAGHSALDDGNVKTETHNTKIDIHAMNVLQFLCISCITYILCFIVLYVIVCVHRLYG